MPSLLPLAPRVGCALAEHWNKEGQLGLGLKLSVMGAKCHNYSARVLSVHAFHHIEWRSCTIWLVYFMPWNSNYWTTKKKSLRDVYQTIVIQTVIQQVAFSCVLPSPLFLPSLLPSFFVLRMITWPHAFSLTLVYSILLEHILVVSLNMWCKFLYLH